MAAPLLEVEALACRRGGRTVLSDVSLSLAEGELLLVAGPNGSGKTTLLRALALLLPADTGRLLWEGADIRGDADSWRASFAWLGHLDGLKGDLSANRNLAVARRLHGLRPQPHEAGEIAAALATFDLAALAERPVRTLSAGQRRRVALARVVASQAPLWLLDEPLNALDEGAHKMLLAALEAHLASGGLAIAATHSPLRIRGARRLELGS